MANESGPFIQAALICEKVLQEQDGAMSAIRIIDRIFFVAGEDGQPLNPRTPIMFLICLKSGEARANLPVEVRLEKPSGEQSQILQAHMLFEGEERGGNIVINAMFEADQQGLYWFDVLLDGTRITRMPLRAVFQPIPTTGSVG